MRPSRLPLRLVAILAVASAWPSCREDESTEEEEPEPPALDVRLVVDPNQTTTADLAARLASIVVVVDAEGGLYRAGEEQASGGVQVKNADADPSDLEIVATLAVDGDALPTFRLERGGLGDVPIDLRVLGFADGKDTPIAEGTLRATRFGDAPRDVGLPFLLRASELPPRVVDVLPADGASIVGCAPPSLTVLFSRPIDPASLEVEGAVTVEPYGRPAAIALDGSGVVATLVLEGEVPGGDGGLALHLEVTGAVRAAPEGTPLDQAPAESGAQAFVADIVLECTPPPTQPCTPGIPATGCPEPCGEVSCTDDPRVACVDGRCEIVGCATSCEATTVCDPAAAACVVDCRVADAIDACAPGLACGAATGLCR